MPPPLHSKIWAELKKRNKITCRKEKQTNKKVCGNNNAVISLPICLYLISHQQVTLCKQNITSVISSLGEQAG